MSVPVNHDASIKKMLKFLDLIPEKYKVGPWSPVTYFVVIGYACFLLYTVSLAIDSRSIISYDASLEWLQNYRLFAGLYGLAITASIFYFAGIWPLASYTLTSWNLMCARFLSSYLAANRVWGMDTLAQMLRFPALVGCSITVSIWWLVLVPLIDHLLSQDKDKSHRTFFWKWNKSFPLLNVHLANLPMVAIEFIYSKESLTFFDLWVAMLVAWLYCIFYLNVLDARGMHFYIIFTPRTAYCAISYVMILTGYYGFYNLWNYVLELSM